MASSSSFAERPAIDPVAGTAYSFSDDPGAYYTQRAFKQHLGGLTVDSAIQPSDLSDDELNEFISGMRAQHAQELAESKQRAAEANAETKAEAEAFGKAIADALALLTPHVDDDADFDSAAGLVRRAVNELTLAVGEHAQESEAAAREPVRASVPASLSVCIRACEAERSKRKAAKAAKLADLQAQLAELGVTV